MLYITYSLAQKDNVIWKSELDFGEGVVFTTFLNIEKNENKYVITSPKNADIRMVGGLKARLGRALGKIPNQGVLLKIESEQNADSIHGTTKLPIFGDLKFKGILTSQNFSGEFIKGDSIVIGTLEGEKSKDNHLDYSDLYSKILKITEERIFSKNTLDNKEWRKFKSKLKKLCNKSKDDIEFFIGFNMINSKLPFSHYNIFISEENQVDNSNEVSPVEPTVIFEEKNPKTAYIKIKNFSTTKQELKEILPKISKNKNYKNLIVDLRDNGGGGIGAAFELAKHIASKDIEVGYFVTNKLEYSGFKQELFETLPKLQPESTEEFSNDLMTGRGAHLIFERSDSEIFSGKIFVLTNKNTGSTCEPIVYALKNNFDATVIGEKTAGAMLAAKWFDVNEKYVLMLPIADFYTTDGVRLDQRGVFPNIDVESEKALEKALEIINTNTNNNN